MGVGSYISGKLKNNLLTIFIHIEIAIGIIGGFSATIFLLSFTYDQQIFSSILYSTIFIIGFLVGMEIPIVMRILKEKDLQFSDIVSNVLSLDYIGALFVSLMFPLILAPKLGMLKTAYLFGLLNAVIGFIILHLFKKEILGYTKLYFYNILTIIALAFGFIYSNHVTKWSEHVIFGDEIIYSESTLYQRIVITRWKADLRLYLNGNLQFSSIDEYRYHESLVHPALSSAPWAKRVLVLGGGDGLAVREILKYPNIEQVTLVELDPKMTGLFQTHRELTKLNNNSLNNKQVSIINADAFKWLEQNHNIYDVIIVDFPDPSNYAIGKLYSVPFYELLKKHISETGRITIQTTSPYYAPKSFWTINATLKSAGFNTAPYHTLVPSFGDWGYIIASKNKYQLPTMLNEQNKYLNKDNINQLFYFPPDMKEQNMEPNHLSTQELVKTFNAEWSKYIR